MKSGNTLKRSVDGHLQVTDLVKHFVQRRGLARRTRAVVRAVAGVSFEIGHGQTLGIVGESGCGKTTLARCVLRLIEPTAGEVILDGVDILKLTSEQLRELRQQMQLVFQNPFSSLDPRSNVLRIVSEPVRAHTAMNHAQVQDRAVELLEQVGMAADHLYRYPHEFSGGQLQRIAIARALALSPKLLVLDEPTAALDVSVQAQIITLLMELQESLGITYLFISHNLTLVHYLADAIAVMYLGRIVEWASASELFDHPLHPYSQALLSSTPAINPKWRRERVILGGSVPDPSNPPPGCAFHPRCQRASEACRQRAPELVDMGEGHLVSCHVTAGESP
jgi:oligopeptide transport system ATP-binding protein